MMVANEAGPAALVMTVVAVFVVMTLATLVMITPALFVRMVTLVAGLAPPVAI